jgi:hypothetical protein
VRIRRRTVVDRKHPLGPALDRPQAGVGRDLPPWVVFDREPRERQDPSIDAASAAATQCRRNSALGD